MVHTPNRLPSIQVKFFVTTKEQGANQAANG